MKKFFSTALALTLSLLQHGRQGLAAAWLQSTGQPLSLRPAAWMFPEYWQKVMALGFGSLGLVWLLFIGAYERFYQAEIVQSAWSCHIQLSTHPEALAMPIPLNLERLGQQMTLSAPWQGIPPQGEVHLLVEIDERGHYRAYHLMHSDHLQLSEWAIQHLPLIVCLPAREGSRPTSAWVPVRFTFGRHAR
jgi:hypothetical protein